VPKPLRPTRENYARTCSGLRLLPPIESSQLCIDCHNRRILEKAERAKAANEAKERREREEMWRLRQAAAATDTETEWEDVF
jgi:predicted neutral ceramidase superfamily lipid hydrolase